VYHYGAIKYKIMTYTGPIEKMATELANPVQYKLQIGDSLIEMNPLLGKQVQLKWLNKIQCMHCGKPTKKSFGQGFCYPCFMSAPETEDCVLRPELCRAHEGIARDMEWATEHCLQDHYVYLALTSDIKVGVTRQTQIPARWIDQGAWKAVKLAKTPNRYLAGLIEVELKQHIKDKTNWREMLTNKNNTAIFPEIEKQRLIALLPDNLKPYAISETELVEIQYPVIQYPKKVNSLDMEKINPITGLLTGIKGQYLMFDYKNVVNIRKYGGYVIELLF
jgi:hypothetical protein